LDQMLNDVVEQVVAAMEVKVVVAVDPQLLLEQLILAVVVVELV